jgi:tripartite-type tricarboxylate transporter receptor subunit TctC
LILPRNQSDAKELLDEDDDRSIESVNKTTTKETTMRNLRRKTAAPAGMRRALVAAAACMAGALALLGPAAALAQAFPSKPVHLVIPYPPGGGTDLVGRTLADGLSRELGQPVIVENKSGAGTVIGSDYVAKSAPDGYTLLLNTSVHAINPSLVPRLPYSADKSFAAVALVGTAPNVLVTRPDKPFKTLADVIAYAKANPGKLSYGSSGNGTAVHLAAELFKDMAKVNIAHIPYRGASPALTDLMGGQVDFVFATAASAGKLVESGRLRAIALTSARRSPSWPDTPTFAEAGVPGYVADVWYALFAPAGTPPEIVARLNAATRRAVQYDLFRKRVEAEGLVSAVGTPEELADFVRAEEARWRKVVKESRISID